MRERWDSDNGDQSIAAEMGTFQLEYRPGNDGSRERATNVASIANTLSTFASNRATVSASFSSTLSGVAIDFLVL
jgi:hypothetical protein